MVIGTKKIVSSQNAISKTCSSIPFYGQHDTRWLFNNRRDDIVTVFETRRKFCLRVTPNWKSLKSCRN